MDAMFGVSSAMGPPIARSLSLETAYQCTSPSQPGLVTINLSGSSSLVLGVGVTAAADIVVGPTAAVAGGTGTVVGKYSNGMSGLLTVGLNISTAQASPCVVSVPAGYYFAIRQTSGTVTIVSAFDQAMS